MSASDFQKVLEWLGANVPGLLIALTAGLASGRKERQQLKARIGDLEVEIAERKNEQDVQNENSGKSDADIIRDFIRKD
jgi:hypothetical protein